MLWLKLIYLSKKGALQFMLDEWAKTIAPAFADNFIIATAHQWPLAFFIWEQPAQYIKIIGVWLTMANTSKASLKKK